VLPKYSFCFLFSCFQIFAFDCCASKIFFDRATQDRLPLFDSRSFWSAAEPVTSFRDRGFTTFQCITYSAKVHVSCLALTATTGDTVKNDDGQSRLQVQSFRCLASLVLERCVQISCDGALHRHRCSVFCVSFGQFEGPQSWLSSKPLKCCCLLLRRCSCCSLTTQSPPVTILGLRCCPLFLLVSSLASSSCSSLPFAFRGNGAALKGLWRRKARHLQQKMFLEVDLRHDGSGIL